MVTVFLFIPYPNKFKLVKRALINIL